ncbi:Regulator_of chromosome condensation 1/beta-lactamase-inhibitor protein II [Hexamita inflata]|uniref:Regulator of chromosome condensation 1/beta-lactamase-inhibitor protein II n=1 Tax=Hexamita inflata TaxID=28002 RepID=A0AA86RIW4_9EUKA|nr:Regulator of chromosome condensation 1/beta-lactamase-inhibitor protein II [Hexamita inflata]
MIGIMTYQSAFVHQYEYPYGTLMTQISSTSNITEVIDCGEVLYQLLENGTLQAKGTQPSLFGNKAQYDFVDINIYNVTQLYCCYGNKLWYVTTAGQVFQEELTDDNITIFTHYNTDGMPASGVRFIAGDTTKFALTDSGIMYYGYKMENIFCGIPNDYIWEYMNLSTKLIPSDIKKLDYSDNFQVLFVYMKNGDVYAVGNNTKGVIAPADTSCQRLLQKGVQNVQISWSPYLYKQVAYFLINNTLFLYNQSKNVKLFSNISDFSVKGYDTVPQITRLLSNNSITTIQESIDYFVNGTDYYCSHTSDPKCDQQLTDSVQCTTSIDPFCYIQNCYKLDNSAGQSCSLTKCAEDNVTCWAMFCMNANKNNQYLQECSFNYANQTYKDRLVNASQYQFKNGFIISRMFEEVEVNKSIFTTWPVVGMTVAGCAVVFTILGISIFMCVKCSMLKKQKPAEKTKKKTKKQSIADQHAPGYTDEGAQHKGKL